MFVIGWPDIPVSARCGSVVGAGNSSRYRRVVLSVARKAGPPGEPPVE